MTIVRINLGALFTANRNDVVKILLGFVGARKSSKCYKNLDSILASVLTLCGLDLSYTAPQFEGNFV